MDKPGWLSKQLASADQTVKDLPSWVRETYERSTESEKKESKRSKEQRTDTREDSQS
jgi:hypothetical protein